MRYRACKAKNTVYRPDHSVAIQHTFRGWAQARQALSECRHHKHCFAAWKQHRQEACRREGRGGQDRSKGWRRSWPFPPIRMAEASPGWRREVESDSWFGGQGV